MAGKKGKGGGGGGAGVIDSAVAVIIKRSCAMDLYQALAVALGVSPYQKKKKKGKGKKKSGGGKKYGKPKTKGPPKGGKKGKPKP